jgi:hypothetical protein
MGVRQPWGSQPHLGNAVVSCFEIGITHREYMESKSGPVSIKPSKL